MANENETNALAPWIRSRLMASLELYVGDAFYEMMVPAKFDYTAGPAACFQNIPMNDVIAGGGRRALVKAQFKVFGICIGEDFTPIAPIADTIDSVLRLDQLAGDGIVAGVNRMRMHQFSEVREDTRFNELGGFYVFDIYPIGG